MESSGTVAITYAWGYECIGDMAIGPGLLRLLRKALPGVVPTIHTYATDSDAHERTASYLRRLDPGLTVLPDPFATLMGMGTPDELTWRFHSLLLNPQAAIRQSRRQHPGVIDSWLDADLRLFNSSMQLTHRRTCGGLRYWLPNALSRQLDLPYALWSQSFGAIDFPGREMLDLFLSDAELLTNRDQYSLDLLDSLPLEGPIMGYTPDPVIFFDHRDPVWADRFLAEQGLTPGEFLVVLPRTYEFWGVETPSALLDERMDKLARTIDLWIERTGQSVLIGYELPREKVRSQVHLWPHLKPSSQEKCRLFSGTWLAEQALSVFAKASAVLSMERYSVYLALTAGAPVLHPTSNAISLRMDVLDRIGLGGSHAMIDSCSHDELAKRLFDLHANRHEHLVRAAAGVAQLQEESVRMLTQMWNRTQIRTPMASTVGAHVMV